MTTSEHDRSYTVPAFWYWVGVISVAIHTLKGALIIVRWIIGSPS